MVYYIFIWFLCGAVFFVWLCIRNAVGKSMQIFPMFCFFIKILLFKVHMTHYRRMTRHVACLYMYLPNLVWIHFEAVKLLTFFRLFKKMSTCVIMNTWRYFYQKQVVLNKICYVQSNIRYITLLDLVTFSIVVVACRVGLKLSSLLRGDCLGGWQMGNFVGVRNHFECIFFYAV